MLGRSADTTYINQHKDELRMFSDVTEQHWSYYHIIESTNSHDYTKKNGVENWTEHS